MIGEADSSAWLGSDGDSGEMESPTRRSASSVTCGNGNGNGTSDIETVLRVLERQVLVV